MQFKIVLILLASLFFACSNHGKKATASVINPGNSISSVKDTIKTVIRDTGSKKKIRPYKEIISEKAKMDSGLFIIQKVDNRYFFEIPRSLFERDILIVSRIARAAANNRPNANSLGYAGDQIGESLIRFSMREDKVFIKSVSYTEVSTDSSENGMFKTVRDSNLQPIVGSFDIKAFSLDSMKVVVDITDFLNSDNNLLYFSAIEKKTYNLSGLQNDKSYIIDLQSFPVNIELRVVNTYAKGEETATYEINTSFLLLPEHPMPPRYHDDRIGYFSRNFVDFDVPNGVDISRMITRWRLEPKEMDIAKYESGQLVEPAKPIVYYIDPATPKKWVPYLIQGVNDWQRAFERAGFKNAIYALEAPLHDPEFNLFDARHNAIIYKPSVVSNASGPHIHDPRSGEILETHINWYHNVMQLLHDWYLIQAGPNDPKAQKMQFDDTLMGKLIRFVACHEVGHTLGLMHNFGASFMVPVDSLRSKTYIRKNGICPSIMDYARFNYVAQPQDSLMEDELLPRVGVYDEWAIEWGYRWLPGLKTKKAEEDFMNHWITSSLKSDKRLWYGPQDFVFVTDPRRQSEDLGDNAMKAGYYGIQNLKRVMKNLLVWTKEPDNDYKSLARMYQQVIDQFQRYLFHVSNNIGLYMLDEKADNVDKGLLEFIPQSKQKDAVHFLEKHLFQTPHWLMDREIFMRTKGARVPAPFASWFLQNQVINDLLNWDRYVRMAYFYAAYPQEAYTFDELLYDLEQGIFSELEKNENVDFYRRNLQRIYIERLIKTSDAFNSQPNLQSSNEFKLKTDFVSISDAHKTSILAKIERTLRKNINNRETKIHLIALNSRLKNSLKNKANVSNNAMGNMNTYSETGLDLLKEYPFLNNSKIKNSKIQSCWNTPGRY